MPLKVIFMHYQLYKGSLDVLSNNLEIHKAQFENSKDLPVPFCCIMQSSNRFGLDIHSFIDMNLKTSHLFFFLSK